MPRSGMNGVDFETNVDYRRLRSDRLERAKQSMKNYGLNAIVCYDFDNIRYITGTHIGEWNRNKMNRYCILIDGVDQPFLFDPAAPSKRKRVDWLDVDHIMPAVGSMRGSIPEDAGMVGKVADQIAGYLKDYGVTGKVGMDLVDIPLIRALEAAKVEIVDGQQAMLDARIIKTDDEIQLLKQSAAMVDAAYYDLAKAVRPGVMENELVAIANYKLYHWGAELVEFVNSISGERGNPHSHTFSNRMVRPGEIIYFDIGNTYNGYKTCYYRTFSCGVPNNAQREAYEKALKWIRESEAQIKPGNTTADVASKWPAATDLGFKNEEEAFLLQFAHGIGLGLWEKPIISRLFSLDNPFELKEGMVFAIETWCPSEDGSGSARIEEEVVVTKDGCERITKFPSEEITSCGLPGCQFL
ncbi:MAG: Xaa-Pro peptidase family protein [Clostridiales Family XIII bacterium]|nr:Xaa-Pro peptidase family protein [Clostridiales Family XIII bacterium]